MATDPSHYAAEGIRDHRQSFDVPPGFNRTTDPPCQTQDSVTDVFICRDQDNTPKGYVVVKRLRATSGEPFCSTEEYRYNGRYQHQRNSYGTGVKAEVPGHITEAASNIQTHTVEK
jgi:hypothetical protein